MFVLLPVGSVIPSIPPFQSFCLKLNSLHQTILQRHGGCLSYPWLSDARQLSQLMRINAMYIPVILSVSLEGFTGFCPGFLESRCLFINLSKANFHNFMVKMKTFQVVNRSTVQHWQNQPWLGAEICQSNYNSWNKVILSFGVWTFKNYQMKTNLQSSSSLFDRQQALLILTVQTRAMSTRSNSSVLKIRYKKWVNKFQAKYKPIFKQVDLWPYYNIIAKLGL
jgi:hypothetical protein